MSAFHHCAILNVWQTISSFTKCFFLSLSNFWSKKVRYDEWISFSLSSFSAFFEFFVFVLFSLRQRWIRIFREIAKIDDADFCFGFFSFYHQPFFSHLSLYDLVACARLNKRRYWLFLSKTNLCIRYYKYWGPIKQVWSQYNWLISAVIFIQTNWKQLSGHEVRNTS